MIKLSLSDIAAILHTTAPQQNNLFQGISTDTRTLLPQNLFIPIRGDRMDGHDFIHEAYDKSAAGALVEHLTDSPLPQILVDNTITALGKIAADWRARFSIPLIGLTGSNGKTTTKNMIASILEAACEGQTQAVLATQGNLNNTIGLPLTLAHLNSTHRYAVIEMGMNQFGEIAYLTQLAKPTVALITNAAESHLQGVKSVAGVAKAKAEIFLGLNADGIAVLNHDDVYYADWRQLVSNRTYLSFGLQHRADVMADILEEKIILHTPQGKIDIILPLAGKHNVLNALAAAAATLAVGIELSAIKTGLEKVQPVSGRMKPYILANGARLIDDSYNANPFSLQAAINTLITLKGKKIVVLGDMKELGAEAKQKHFVAGQKMREAGIDYLFTLGELSAAATEGFGQQAQHFNEREKLLVTLGPYLSPGNIILIKGSRSMQMEKIILKLIPDAHIEHAH